MKIPPDAIVPEEKLTHYLLVPREHDDKSQFLSQAGFTLDNPQALLRAIRRLTNTCEAVEEGKNEYGEFFRLDGDLRGTKGRKLAVATIWLRWVSDGQFRFITLIPQKGRRRET